MKSIVSRTSAHHFCRAHQEKFDVFGNTTICGHLFFGESGSIFTFLSCFTICVYDRNTFHMICGKLKIFVFPKSQFDRVQKVKNKYKNLTRASLFQSSEDGKQEFFMWPKLLPICQSQIYHVTLSRVDEAGSRSLQPRRPLPLSGVLMNPPILFVGKRLADPNQPMPLFCLLVYLHHLNLLLILLSLF